MEKGSLRTRSQTQSQSKKKHLTMLQQVFMLVKENRIAEVKKETISSLTVIAKWNVYIHSR